jgi:hypothetical protein
VEAVKVEERLKLLEWKISDLGEDFCRHMTRLQLFETQYGKPTLL